MQSNNTNEPGDLPKALEKEIDVLLSDVHITRRFDGRLGNPKNRIKANILRLVRHRLDRDYASPSEVVEVLIEELNSLSHNKQMFGDWQQVIDDRIAELQSQLPKKEKTE